MERGDVYLVDLDPTRGGEQRGRRPVLIVTKANFNRGSPPLICPITSGGVEMRLAGLTVSLAASGMRTTGVVLCNQVRAVDLKDRKAKRIERAPDVIVEEVLAVLEDLLE